MSIASEIERISGNVQSTIDTIRATGVTVPEGANSDDLPSLAQALATTKQDKLTGTAGQVVGFDAEGNAEAQDAPSGLPEGGTAGQILAKSETGAEWVDKPVLYVTLDSVTATADKTFDEIITAYNLGYAIYAKGRDAAQNRDIIMPLATCSTNPYNGYIRFETTNFQQNNASNARYSAVVYQNGVAGMEPDTTVSAQTITYKGTNVEEALDALNENKLSSPTNEGTSGQILTKTADGTAWENPPDSGVTTFNGRSGAVAPQTGDYTADMVGARPNTWTPTASDVGAVPTSRTINGKPLSDNVTLAAADVQARPNTWLPTVYRTATLSSSGWSSNTQTITVSGVSATETTQLIQPMPAIASQEAYMAAGIYCSGQAANSLTFTCSTVPTENITLYVTIQEVSA